MKVTAKRDLILDALQNLLKTKDIHSISISDIAQEAGIGKGSIYYYFDSKDSILAGLIERNYNKTIETAKTLVRDTHVDPFTRMAMIFQACRNASMEYFKQSQNAPADNSMAAAYLHQKYIKYLIEELKPELTEIIQQGIDLDLIHFEHPGSLAEIVLIILTVKLGNILSPSSPEEIESTIQSLIVLLERGTDIPPGSLNYLTTL